MIETYPENTRPIEVTSPDPNPLSYYEKAILAEIECIRCNDTAVKMYEGFANDEWRRRNHEKAREYREKAVETRRAVSECFERIHAHIEAMNPPF